MEESSPGKMFLIAGNCTAPRKSSQAPPACRILRSCSDHRVSSQSQEDGMTTFLGGKHDIELEKENNASTVKSPIYL